MNQRLSRVTPVHYAETPDALVEAAASGQFAVILSGLGGRRGHSIAPIMADLAARAPAVPVVLYGEINRSSVGELSAICTPGLPIEFVMRGAESLAAVVRQVFIRRVVPSVAPLLLNRFLPLAPPSLKPFIAILALKAPSRRRVEHLARWTGVTRRTIGRRLQRARWAEPHIIRQSFRALDAIWLMTEQRWSAHIVAQLRGFGSTGAVGKLTYRYTGMRPATFREFGDFPAALDAVQQVIVHHAHGGQI